MSLYYKGQKLVRVTKKMRRVIREAAQLNRRWRRQYETELWWAAAPGACEHCGAQPSGHLWPDSQCCERSTQQPMEGWEHTHTAFEKGYRFPVMEMAVQPGDRIFFRQDGIVEFIELGPAKSGLGSEGSARGIRPRVLFQGKEPHGGGLYVRGREKYDEEDQWQGRGPAYLEERLEGVDHQEPDEGASDGSQHEKGTS